MLYYRPTRWGTARRQNLWCLLLLVACCAGCGSLSRLSPRSRSMASANDPERNIGKIQGPTERLLKSSRWRQDRDKLAAEGDPETLAALARYDAAQALFDAGNYAEAEKAFGKLASDRRGKYESFGAKFNRFWGITDSEEYDPYANFGDAIEEDAMFMLAESQFAQRRYSKAQDSYDALLNRYPSSRHLDASTRQLFRIARYWLNFPENIGETGDVQLADGTQSAPGEPQIREASALDRVPVLPNLTDRTRPLFDTYGHGERALRSIWLHDATGPLADDALMMAANHNLRTADYVEAARLYTLLREQYPDSPHVKDAYLLGSHVTLASYQGAAYDGKSLTDARELKEVLLQSFPDLDPQQRQELLGEVEKLKDAEVARLWDLVEFYQVKRVDSSVALHCHLIVNRYPDSRFADEARKVLAELDEKQRRAGNSLWPWGRPPAPVATTPPPVPEIKPPVEEKPSTLQRFGGRLFRADQPPKLQPIDEPPAAPSSDSSPPASISL